MSDEFEVASNIVEPIAPPVMVLAVGFCSACCVPLTEQTVLRSRVDGEHMLFCSDSCIGKYGRYYRVIPMPLMPRW